MIPKTYIDLSYSNGYPDFDKIKEAGIDGVILRIGYTGYGVNRNMLIDSKFEYNYANAERAGLDIGGYWYSTAVSQSDAVKEANKCIDLIADRKFTLPIFIDIEDNHNTANKSNYPINQGSLSKEQLTPIAIAFCDKLIDRGYFSGVYASLNWWNTKLDYETLSKYARWCANWNSDSSFNGANYDIWQWTCTGKIDGIQGNVDMSFCYTDFPRLIKNMGVNNSVKLDGKLVKLINDFISNYNSYIKENEK